MSSATPETVGRYKVIAELGRGAMGAVYRGTDPKLDRTVAIKMISSAMGAGDDHQEILARFEREARVSARLQHPNVVAVYDVGSEGDELYLVMELVEGEDLSHKLARGEFPTIPEALDFIAQAADALGAAHEAGIIHRDIKPGNLLITKKGRIKVSDFGVAKAIGEKTDLTSTGMMVGSPAYMSPEQVKGMNLDGRSDLFSLGVVLFEMLLHRKPFPADTVTTLVYQILHEDPMNDVPIPQAVSADLADFLRWTMSKDREARIPDARTFASRARSLAAGEPMVRPDAQTPTAMMPIPNVPESATAVMSAPAGPAAGTTQVAEKKSKTGLFVGIGAVVVAAAGAGIFLSQRDGGEAQAPVEQSQAPAVQVQTVARPSQVPSAGPSNPAELLIKIPDQADAGAAAAEAEVEEPPATDLAPGTSEVTAAPKPPAAQPEGRARAAAQAPSEPQRPQAPAQRPAEAPARQAPVQQAPAQTQAPAFTVPEVEIAETYDARKGAEFHVRPDSAMVTINGVTIGKADDWDGFAGGRQYPFGAPGSYFVELTAPGYKTAWVKIVVKNDARADFARVRTKLEKAE